MSAPRPTVPAPMPERPSLEPLPQLPSWRAVAVGARPSALPTDDIAFAPGSLVLVPAVDVIIPPQPNEPDEGPTTDLGIPPASEDSPVPLVAPAGPETADERRNARRHRLLGASVRAVIHDATGAVEGSRGRVRDISADGGLFIETRAPLPVRAVVRVAMAVSPSQAMRLTGTVVRSNEEGMAVRLRVDEQALGFLNVYVAVAREAKKSGAMEIRVERMANDVDDPATIVLDSAWHELRAHPDDAEVHRRFLDACVSAQRYDYATDRLRELKGLNPDVAEIERSLEHMGRILGFVALARAPRVESVPVRSRALLVLAALLVLGALLLGFIASSAPSSSSGGPARRAHPASDATNRGAISAVPR